MPYEAGLGSVVEFLHKETANANAEVGKAFLACALGMTGLSGFELRSGGHGYIAPELRAYQDDKAFLAAVMNKNWVRLYIRKPALNSVNLDVNSILRTFGDATFVEHCGEVAINLSDANRAYEIMEWLSSRLLPECD